VLNIIQSREYGNISRLFFTTYCANLRLNIVKKILFIVFLIVPFATQAQSYFEESPLIKEAYGLIIDLQFDRARTVIQKIKKEEPQNLLVLHLDNYIDFFTIFINEEKDQFKKLEKNKEKRLDKIERDGDFKSPYYLFVQAEIELQWALARAKFNGRFNREVIKAGTECLSAYKLLTENQKRFPNFIANKKSLSAIHVLAESIPGFVRKVFSIDGTIAQGTSEIEEVIKYSNENDFLYKEEAIAIYTYILFYQNNRKREAWDFLQQSDLDPVKSPLVCFLMANMAQKIGENDQAIELLESRPQGSDYFPFHYLEFMLGKCKLYRLDDDAVTHLSNYLSKFKGAHYIKEAHQKLGWYELVVHNNIPKYKKYMKACQNTGNELIDGDKQAQKEAKRNLNPHPTLLKARLLYDGGYNQRAYGVLIRNAHLFNNASDNSLEYFYRLGRVTQSLGNPKDAIDYYNEVILKGSNSEQYYACNAALQVALIFEEQKDYRSARDYFNKCLDMSPSDYKNSLHQKAKSGLNRVKGK